MKYFMMTMGFVFVLGFGSESMADTPCYDFYSQSEQDFNDSMACRFDGKC